MKPILRFPEFISDWEEKKLKDIACINPKSNDTKADVINYIDLESVNGNKVTDIKKIYKENAPSRAQRIAKDQDIFFQTVRPYQQNNFIYNFDIHNIVVSTGYAQIRVHRNAYYIFTLLHTYRFLTSVLMNCTGSNYPAINGTDLSSIKVIYSSDEEEQRKIGDFFSKLDQQIELEEKKLAKLEEQKKGYMQKIFSQELRFKDDNGKDYPAWEIKKLGDLYKYQQGQQIPVENQYKMQINNMKRFIRIVDVTENPKKRYIKDRKESGLINQKDLIMIRYGASAGTISMGYEGVIANNLFKFVKKQNVDNRYFYFLLKKSHFKIKSLSSQSAMPALNFNAMDTLKFSIPQYSEQQKIGGFFSELDKLVEKQNQKIDGLKERKKGFLQKMFV